VKYVAVAVLTLAPLASHWLEAIAKDQIQEGDGGKVKYEKLIKQIAEANTKKEVVSILDGQIDSEKLKRKLGINGAKKADETVKWVVDFFAALLMNKEIKSQLSGEVIVSTRDGERGCTEVFVRDHDKNVICKILVSKKGSVYDVEAVGLSALKFFGDNAAASSKKPLVSQTRDERCDVYIKFSKDINAKGDKGLEESLSTGKSKK
jgi:hypothetical protein